MVHQDPGAGRRLDGWKSIAAYFNRDRTTAMRWARERGLPVRRMPGGKHGSIFALEHELAAWALRQGNLMDDADEAEPPPTRLATADIPDEPPPLPRKLRRLAWLAPLGVAAAAAGAAWIWQGSDVARLLAPSPTSPTSLASFVTPRDPAVARDYIAARDAWARRTPAGLERAIRLYTTILRRDPTFAPAHVGMADAWLIFREYGRVDEATAYRNARHHVAIALRLDPRSPGAHRALGFIDYWWNGRPDRAMEHFRHAIALDDRDAQSHFWFANMLADIGRDSEAQAEYDRARLLDPGSRVIEVEQACAHWQAGRDDQALRELRALAVASPGDATIQNCLAWVYISRGDIMRFSEAFGERARLRREPRLMLFATILDRAVREDPTTAVRALVAESRREIAAGERQLRETPAFYASAMGDRATLIQLLIQANDVGERWPSFPVTRRIANRWRDDAEVQRLLRPLIRARS